MIPERIVYTPTLRKLPTILSADEAVRFLEAAPSLKARAPLISFETAGLHLRSRKSEGCGHRQVTGW